MRDIPLAGRNNYSSVWIVPTDIFWDSFAFLVREYFCNK